MANRMAIGETWMLMSGNWRARYQQVELALRLSPSLLQSTRAPRARYLLMRIMAFQPDVKGIATVLILTWIYLARP